MVLGGMLDQVPEGSPSSVTRGVKKMVWEVKKIKESRSIVSCWISFFVLEFCWLFGQVGSMASWKWIRAYFRRVVCH